MAAANRVTEPTADDAPTPAVHATAARIAVRRSRRIWTSFIAIVSGLIFFSVTAPQGRPSLLLLVGFIFFGLLAGSIVRLGLIISGFEVKLSSALRRGVIVGLAGLPTALLILQSIGQLTSRDLLVLLGFCGLTLFYWTRLRHNRS